MKKIIVICMVFAALFSACSKQSSKEVKDMTLTLEQKVKQYSEVELKTDISFLSESEKEVLGLMIDVAQIMDDIYWIQAYGDKNEMLSLTDPWQKEFALINYGPWDRMADWKPFIPNAKVKRPGVNFYPADMTKEEFEALQDPDKNSQYTVIKRGTDGKLYVKGYYEEYKEHLDKAIALMEKAAKITENKGLKNYLEKRIIALKTNQYFDSDMAWMDMKDSNLDFVVGPIENYDDELFGLKTSFEAFVLVKDLEWSKKLSKYTKFLPELQKNLPVDAKYKQEKPGTESDLNVYDVVYYGGDCNAAGKTIAINLPNDEKVQLKKGSRRLQLKNAMQAKFDAIVVPIAKQVMNPEQMKQVNFNAFFSDVTFHEVAHGLGIKTVVGSTTPVRKALGSEYSAYEEAKADVLGLYMISELIKKGEVTDLTEEECIATYVAGLFRSIRFGVTEAHGRANILCFNYFEKNGAFTRDAKGIYTINYDKAKECIRSWAKFLIEMEGNGDMVAATKYSKANAVISKTLQQDLDKINSQGIPVDVRFNQGRKVLGL
jgi:tetratricopeptide (TPR) repeat protein